MGLRESKITKFSICLLTAAAVIRYTSVEGFNHHALHPEEDLYNSFSYDIPREFPPTNHKMVDDGLILKGRDEIYEELFRFCCSCYRFMDMLQKYESQLKPSERNFYRGNSAGIVKQVQLDTIFNVCQNSLDVLSAYHQALITENQPLPWYYREPHKGSMDSG